jgi:hypothetical protein
MFKKTIISYLKKRLCLAGAILVCLLFTNAVNAESIRIPLKVIEGQLIIYADVSSQKATREFSLLLHLDGPYDALIVPESYDLLQPQKGEENFVFNLLPGIKGYVNIDTVRMYQGLDVHRFNATYGDELDQRALSGAIGLKFFKNYHIVFDLDNSEMILSPASPKESSSIDNIEADYLFRNIKVEDEQIWLPLTYDNDKKGYMALSTYTYDTYVNKFIVEKLSKPHGNIGPVYLDDGRNKSKINLSNHVAYRVHPFIGDDADDMLLISGLNLFKNFKVEIDLMNDYVALWQTKPAKYPQSDFDFFKIEADGNKSKELLTWLEKNSGHRLGLQASETLFKNYMSEGASEDKLLKAIRFVRDNEVPVEQAGHCYKMMKLLRENRPEAKQAIILAGELGIESARASTDPMNLYRIHSMLGQMRYDSGEIKTAWKHFLSASFGQPNDAVTNLYFGKVYEAQERYRRAYARYKRAAESSLSRTFSQEQKQDAIDSMARLKDKIPKDDGLLLFNALDEVENSDEAKKNQVTE